MKHFYLLLLFTVFTSGMTCAQTELPSANLSEYHDFSPTQQTKQAGDQALVLFLFGAFCALWAQNTGRSGWLWFFLGVFFSIIAVLVLLGKNAGDLNRKRVAARG